MEKKEEKKPRKLKPKLKAQEIKFVHLYIKHTNLGLAYQLAGYKSSSKFARQSGYRLLHRPDVQEYYHDLISKMEQKELINTQALVQQWVKIAFADPKDYISWKGKVRMKEVQDEKGETQVIMEGPQIEVFNSDNVDGSVVQEISFSPKDGFKLKLEPKQPALEKLAKVSGMLIDKSEQIVKKIDLQKLDNKQLEKLANGETVEKVLVNGAE